MYYKVSSKVVKLHKMSSAIDEKQTCQLCGYQTLKKTHLKLHEQEVHDGKKFLLQCVMMTNNLVLNCGLQSINALFHG
jgi:hypothetical protein